MNVIKTELGDSIKVSIKVFQYLHSLREEAFLVRHVVNLIISVIMHRYLNLRGLNGHEFC